MAVETVGSRTPSNNRVEWEPDPQEGGHAIQEGYNETFGKAGAPSKKGNHGSQDLQVGGHAIQEGVQWERGTLGVRTLGKADTPSKKGYNASQGAWENGRTQLHHLPLILILIIIIVVVVIIIIIIMLLMNVIVHIIVQYPFTPTLFGVSCRDNVPQTVWPQRGSYGKG